MPLYDMTRIAHDLFGLEDETPREEYRVLCPLHTDHRPSMILQYDGGWKCYPCGRAGGLPISLIKQWYGCTTMDALDILLPYWNKDDTGDAAVPVGRAGVRSKEEQQERTVANLALAEDIYRRNVTYHGFHADWEQAHRTGSAAHFYLFSRGVLAATAQRYKLAVISSMKNYPLIFPLFFVGKGEDAIPEIYGYISRTINGVLPKYLTMEGLEKHTHIYGIAERGEPLLVTEGRINGMIAWQAVGCSEVSLLGADIHEQQIQMIVALQPPVVVAGFDMDAAGERAAVALKEKLAPYGILVRRLRLPRNDVAVCRTDAVQAAWARASRLPSRKKPVTVADLVADIHG